MMFTPDLIAQLAWTGLASSSSYCLFALAFALVLKVNRIWNFGQAGIMVVAYFSMYFAFQNLGLPLVAGLILGAAITIAASLGLEKFGFNVFRNRKTSTLTYFIFTMTFSHLMIYTAELFFGTHPKTLFSSIMSPVMLVGPIVVSHWDLIAMATAGTLVLGLWLFLRKTNEGKALIAVSDEPDLAEMYGISKQRAYLVSMALAAILLTAGMYLMGTKTSMYPATPMNQYLILAIIATILGGIGNVFAAGVAAIALALIQSFSILVIPSTWQVLLLYILIFVVIIMFPRGVVLYLPRRGPARDAGALAPQAAAKTGDDA
jgi:branched-subunit amino acid ABC-type transport system permease component